jgi:quercetin dioxygenase-like cupin family protein
VEKQSISSFQVFKDSRFTKQIIYKNSNSTVFILNFIPGQHMPAHYHFGAELYFHVLQGNGIFTIEESDLQVTKGDVVHCEGTKKLSFTNTGNEIVSIYVTLSKLSAESIKYIDDTESC